jgi:hypothetical protein
MPTRFDESRYQLTGRGVTVRVYSLRHCVVRSGQCSVTPVVSGAVDCGRKSGVRGTDVTVRVVACPESDRWPRLSARGINLISRGEIAASHFADCCTWPVLVFDDSVNLITQGSGLKIRPFVTGQSFRKGVVGEARLWAQIANLSGFLDLAQSLRLYLFRVLETNSKQVRIGKREHHVPSHTVGNGCCCWSVGCGNWIGLCKWGMGWWSWSSSSWGWLRWLPWWLWVRRLRIPTCRGCSSTPNRSGTSNLSRCGM